MISVEKPGSPEEVLEHFGKKGMKWGVRNERSANSETRANAKLTKQITKADKKLSDTIANPRKANQLKAQLHNDIVPVVNSKVNVINSKPKYYKAIHDGTLHNPNSPITKAYANEVNNMYMKTMNDHLKGFSNASGTKVVTAHLNSKDYLGFTLKLSDRPGVKHEDPLTMRVDYIKDKNGAITGFVMANDSMMQTTNRGLNALVHMGIEV